MNPASGGTPTSAPDTYYPAVSRSTLDQLEFDVALGNITAMQLFTRMRTLITHEAAHWAPMSTVPTDGSPVLVLLEPSERGGERVQSATYRKTAQGSVMGVVGDYFDFDKPKALAWMRPPAAPEVLP